ncbi:alpha-mannosidase [Subtercola endophyticus]|uniref:alpha-mannosidase n=1 Tax=Subtercola endophyticus TaxID=2895559 RepID=UPI001E40AB1A|nr:glycoside hydrolase family 38 C-terminal domain-containing protein [Subtercola endophyticus]UFS60187.1 glycosyl hydrolase-related protein [Subtercola endophyticus]
MANFATWLFGIAAQEPLEYRRLRRLRSRIYRVVAPVEAEIIRSPEPIPFGSLDRSAFTPAKPGTSWGRTHDCAWIRLTGTIPERILGEPDTVVMLGIRGEALVHDARGGVIDSVSTVFLQGDLPHAGAQYRPMHHVEPDEHGNIELFADVSYNGFLLYAIGRGVYHGAHVATRNDEAFALYYDYLTLLVLARATDDHTLESSLRRALATSYERFAAHDLRGARVALAASLEARSESDFVYSAIGHGHLDMAWLWPLRETHRKAARTYVRAVNTIEEHDGYLYGTSQPQQLFWMKQEQPALYERVKEAVAAKRIELQGSFWVETDTNLAGGEALIRQSLVGRRFLKEEFGLGDEDLRLCWLPDTFGYSGNLPQIISKSGMDWFQTIKLAWNKVTVFPHRSFVWKGIDGSSVLVHMPPEGDYNSRGAADGLLRGLAQYPEKAINTALLVYGSGDGGGGPNEVHLEVTGREHDLRGLPRVEYRSAGDFFRGLETKVDELPHTHTGELYLETHQGTYTTQALIKKHDRIAGRKLHEAEALAAIAGDDSTVVLEPHWRALLLNNFHDILPGSSIARVNREAVEAYEGVETAADTYIGELVDRLPRVVTTTPDAPPSVINLTSFARHDFTQLHGRWYRADVAPYAAAALSPLTPDDTSNFNRLDFTSDTMTNGILTLRFAADGSISSCRDAAGVEHSAGGLNRLTLHRDPYQWPFDAWDIGQKYTSRAPRVLTPSHVSTTIDGPQIIRSQTYTWKHGEIEQRIVLESGSELVRFETRIDWHEKHHMLRADFWPAHYGPVATCEIQFGHIERATTELDAPSTAQFEVCAHKWLATSNESGGFALLNDGKYGHRAKSGLISLNLLRSPTFPDKTADRGSHSFTYAFRPFAPDALTDVIRDGYRLNNPLLTTAGVSFDSVASVDHPGVVIETLKPAEGGRGVIVRLYESLGEPTTTALRTTLEHSRASETDLIERATGPADLDRLEFTPFEIKTILLER